RSSPCPRCSRQPPTRRPLPRAAQEPPRARPPLSCDPCSSACLPSSAPSPGGSVSGLSRRRTANCLLIDRRSRTRLPLGGVNPGEPEPRGKVVQLGLDGLRHRPRELHVLVDRVHL